MINLRGLSILAVLTTILFVSADDTEAGRRRRNRCCNYSRNYCGASYGGNFGGCCGTIYQPVNYGGVCCGTSGVSHQSGQDQGYYNQGTYNQGTYNGGNTGSNANTNTTAPPPPPQEAPPAPTPAR